MGEVPRGPGDMEVCPDISMTPKLQVKNAGFTQRDGHGGGPLGTGGAWGVDGCRRRVHTYYHMDSHVIRYELFLYYKPYILTKIIIFFF